MMGQVERYLASEFGEVCVVRTAADFAVHAHPEPTMTFAVSGNRGVVHVDGRRLRSAPDVAVTLNSYQPHTHRMDGVEGRFLCFKLDPRWCRSRWGELDGGRRLFPMPETDTSAMIKHLVDAVLVEPPHDDACVRLIDAVVAVAHGGPERGVLPTVDYRLRRAIALMQADPGREIDLHALARASGLSRARFCQLFRARLGVTPAVYWNMLRVAEAAKDLGTADRSLTLIRQRLGFSSAAHFSRFFRDRTGLAPRAYREGVRSGSRNRTVS